MGLCDDPPRRRDEVDGQEPDIVFDDVSDIDDDAESQGAQFEDISDAEQAPVAQPYNIEYEDISEPEDDSPPSAVVGDVEFFFEPYVPVVQSATYLVTEQGHPPEIQTLYNWDQPSGSVALWFQYLNQYEQWYGAAARDQFARDFLCHGGTIYSFGRILKDIYDIRYFCLD